MYLKKIEVQGFKSFANKLLFEFDNGITGIVGPNGSGKSNIADAVRWVLGEQSAKQLRGSNMQDVIFAGTETRKPVSFASVSLTIDNSDHKLDIDFDEVTVTRRVFRSGESEYLLNGNSCRLKDIHELFYDTGIGKEGYSIIGQGQIDKILSGKPDERRELFDEAAGIVKYKRRKNAAQKSLDNESNNLIRINDILAELEKQVGPLAKQSEKAREYLKLKESLKRFEVNLFLLEAESLKNSLKETEDKLNIVNNDIKDTNEEYIKIKTVYDEKNNEIEEKTTRIEELNTLISQAEIDKNRLMSQIEILKEQIKSVNSNDEHLSERLRSIEEQIEERNEEKNKLMQEKFAIGEQIDEIYLRQREADLNVDSLNEEIRSITEEIESGKNKIFENLNQKGLIRTNIQRYETMLEQIGIRKAELNSKLISFKTDESEFDNSINSQKKQLDELNNEIDELNKLCDSLNLEKQNCRTERNELREKLTAAKDQNMRSQSRLETLKNIAERYDGYGNSIRKVMECKEHNKGVLGVVADIIKTEKKYEVAIETALGGTIQNIVTDTEDTAKKMISYLKQNKFGRATFLPLSAISDRRSGKENLEKEQGFIGYGSDLVTVDKEYIQLAGYLLGRCVVVDNIDNALKFNKKYSYSLKIVTLEGELLNPGGSMTGGAFKNTSNLLGRRREIEDLEEIINRTLVSITTITKGIERDEERIRIVSEELNSNQEILQQKLLVKNTVELQYNQMAAKQDEMRNLYADHKREASEIDSQIKEINESLEKLRGELDEIESYNETTTARTEELSIKSEQLKEVLTGKIKLAEAVHIEYSEISQKAAFAEESVKRVLREIDRLKDGIDELADSKENSAKEVEEKNKAIENITETIEIAGNKITEYTEELTQLKSQKELLTQAIKSFFDSREECQQKLVSLEKEQYRLSQTAEKLESLKDSRIDYMWNEYEITLSQAMELKDEDLSDESEIKATVSRLKGDIRKLGDVNVNAIEDYKDVSERYEFLKNQHDDLIIARDKLISVIDELEKGMRERFTEKFGQIKVEFDKVFKQLFGGGKGTIELDPEADILEADISIISQPPGKKLQNMMQLSGGEKALTAICLLFAIQNLKPSPFCLLDEIEAALDDSNVDRYARYLHNLTKNTQFIVITHRRGTMAAADRLYGITMQEKGVSTLVSVDLIEKQLDEPDKNGHI